MAENTNIEWCDATFNPWEGCQKVGPGCDHCYAETRNARYAGGTAINWGPDAPRRRTSAANWKKPVKWNKQQFWQCACGWRGADVNTEGGSFTDGLPSCPCCDSLDVTHTRARVFCSSLADVFDNAVDPKWRADLFALIEETPNLDWLLLTKRIGNAGKMIRDARLSLVGSTRLVVPEVLPNVWLGATIVNQAEADRDVPKLLDTPAAKRFLSMEPLLGPVDLWHLAMPDSKRTIQAFDGLDSKGCVQFLGGLDWVIVGGESGAEARPMSIQWARELRDQCDEACVPFLFKQWGEWAPAKVRPSESPGKFAFGDYDHDRTHFVRTEHYPRSFTSFGAKCILERVGKKAAGRLLDGREHNGVPNSLQHLTTEEEQ